MQVASFEIDGQEYALDIMQIKEIINPVPITPVPRAPAFVEGIIELRGAVLPVVDLRKRFDAPANPPTRETKYVIVSLSNHIVGLVVDRVREVMRVDVEDILDAPSMATGLDAQFVSGVYKRDGRILIVLDIGRILSASERSVLDQLGQGE
jgi:purine-binding chemotaxis protein CheW